MEKAEARRLQPYFVRSFFMKAFQQLGGELRPREPGRFEITHVPAVIRERDRLITGRNRRNADPVLQPLRARLLREGARPPARPRGRADGQPAPSRPPADAVGERPGAGSSTATCSGRAPSWWTRPTMGLTPKLLFLLDHEVKEGGDRRRWSHAAAVRRDRPRGQRHLRRLGAAPRPGTARRRPTGRWSRTCWPRPGSRADLEQVALAHAADAPRAGALRRSPRAPRATVDKTLAAVHERLIKEINFWSDRYIKLQDDLAAGKDVRLNLENVRRTVDDLDGPPRVAREGTAGHAPRHLRHAGRPGRRAGHPGRACSLQREGPAGLDGRRRRPRPHRAARHGAP